MRSERDIFYRQHAEFESVIYKFKLKHNVNSHCGVAENLSLTSVGFFTSIGPSVSLLHPHSPFTTVWGPFTSVTESLRVVCAGSASLKSLATFIIPNCPITDSFKAFQSYLSV